VQFLRSSRRLRFLAVLVNGVPAVLRCCCRVLIIGAAFDFRELGQRLNRLALFLADRSA
jgi:hypothetical protein